MGAVNAPARVETLIPYRHVPSLRPDSPAPLYLLDINDDSSTSCTDLRGDRDGDLCLCHWSPWVDRDGFAEEDYEPQIGDPFADLPAAEPWRRGR